jgi:hypothetical protein
MNTTPPPRIISRIEYQPYRNAAGETVNLKVAVLDCGHERVATRTQTSGDHTDCPLCPPDIQYGRCKACAREIRWLTSRQGKNLAVNPDPDPTGNITIAIDGAALIYRSPQQAPEYATLYRIHASTCQALLPGVAS